jgi:RNA polymerase sigma factor (sigma-70 family)
MRPRIDVCTDYGTYKPPEGLTGRERLVLENLKLVVHHAFKMAMRPGRFQPEVEDLVQCGMLGLLRAANWAGDGEARFDPARGQFSTYASIWIRRMLIWAMRRDGVVTGGSRLEGEARLMRGADQFDAERDSVCSHDDPEDQSEQIERLLAALKKLKPTEAYVIRRRFGLEGEPATLEAIAQSISRSRQRVQQIEKRALEKIPALMLTA